jgi:hypothetical protein
MGQELVGLFLDKEKGLPAFLSTLKNLLLPFSAHHSGFSWLEYYPSWVDKPA